MVRAPKSPLYLVATDGSAPANEAVEYAVQMAKRDRARLGVVTVQPTGPLAGEALGMGPVPAPSTIEWMQRQSDDLVQQSCKRAAHFGVAATGVTLPPQEPATAVVRYAESEQASLIVVGSHGRTGLRRMLLGSVAERIVRLSHCPVLVVR